MGTKHSTKKVDPVVLFAMQLCVELGCEELVQSYRSYPPTVGRTPYEFAHTHAMKVMNDMFQRSDLTEEEIVAMERHCDFFANKIANPTA